MNKTINFNTDDPEELQQMIKEQNEGAEDNASENSFSGAFEEHFQEFEQAKSEGCGSL